MRLEVDATGVDRASSRFVRLQHRLDNPRPVFEQVADVLRAGQRRRFATRGDGRWPALSRSTVRKKGHARVLYMTGALQRSLASRGAGSVQQVTGSQMRFGTSLFYARFVAKRRPLFSVRATEKRQISARVLRYLMAD